MSSIFDYMSDGKKEEKKETNKKQLTIFDFMNAIYTKDRSLEYDKKIAPAFLLSLWFSHDDFLLPIVQKLNKIGWMIPDRLVYQYYMDKIPKGKRFIKYTKKDKIKEVNLNEIQEKYNLSRNEALHYIKLFRP